MPVRGVIVNARNDLWHNLIIPKDAESDIQRAGNIPGNFVRPLRNSVLVPNDAVEHRFGKRPAIEHEFSSKNRKCPRQPRLFWPDGASEEIRADILYANRPGQKF